MRKRLWEEGKESAQPVITALRLKGDPKVIYN